MAEEKRDARKRETKAGLMDKNSDQTENVKDEIDLKPENTPKISKEQAEEQDRERPLH